MNLLSFPEWQTLIRIVLVAVAAIVACITALHFAKVWGPRATQATDTIGEGVWAGLMNKSSWIMSCLAAVVALLVLFGPKTVLQSVNTIQNLWPTATPVPPPRWDVYVPLARR